MVMSSASQHGSELKARRIVLLGPPGAGKGTQAELLAQELAVPHIAAGDLLRAEVQRGGPLGQEAQGYMDRGELVPHELVVRIVGARLAEVGRQGFILDGFPRDLAQAEALEQLVQVERVIHLVLSREEVIRRLSARLVCAGCGQNYQHLLQEGRCQRCGGELVRRSDDRPEVVAKRYDEQYNNQIEALLHFYRELGERRGLALLRTVSGEGSVETVRRRLLEALG